MVRCFSAHLVYSLSKTGEELNRAPGCCQEFICVPATEIELCPVYLSDQEAAAVPLAALTAWRATIVKAAITAGQTVLITGIGGGVALFCLQFAVEQGTNVYVSSGSDEKIARAVRLGARGGVNYKNADWPEKLLTMLPEGNRCFDAVIDSAGGDIVGKSVGLLRTGGIISSYGMTLGPKVMFSMPAVMKNIEVCSPCFAHRSSC
jgi:NADPH:quinone reductase-like Zn-dependent oxidoreductase